MNLFHCVLMFLTLSLTLPKTFLPHFVYIVAQCHLLLHLFYPYRMVDIKCEDPLPDIWCIWLSIFFRGVTIIDPVTCDLYDYCCYFELDEKINAKLNKYIKYVVSEVRVLSETALLILKFLPATIFVAMNYRIKTWCNTYIPGQRKI